MGYNTDFRGELYIKPALNVLQMTALDDLLEAHRFKSPYLNLASCQSALEQYLEWDESEKTYDMDQQVRYLIQEMREIVPDFSLEGEFLAQGENSDDRWILKVSGDRVERFNILETGHSITCPSCGHAFDIPHGEHLK